MKIKAIVFDLWFTVIPGVMDFEHLRRLINASHISVNEFIKTYEEALMTKRYHNFEELRQDFLRAFPHQNTKLSEAELREVFYNRIQKIAFYSDVLPCLQYLRTRGYKIALLSNMESIMLERVVNELIPQDYFDVTGYSSEIGAIKPDPKAFIYVLRKLGVEPQQALMVGDSLHSDIAGADAVGMHHCLINRSGNVFGESRVKPQFEIKSLEELPRVLERLGKRA